MVSKNEKQCLMEKALQENNMKPFRKHPFTANVKNSIFLLFLFAAVIGITGAAISCKSEKKVAATIKFIKGKANIFIDKTELPAKLGQKLSAGNIIQTEENSIVILEFAEQSANIELQANASLEIKDYSEKSRDLFLKKGSAWVYVNKLKKGGVFNLHTPTSTAGVRGTKFYTFTMGDEIYGTCHCEGTIDYHAETSDFRQKNEEDYIVFTRGSVSAIVTQEDIESAGIVHSGHNHSMLSDSPLGNQYSLTPEEEVVMMNLVETKLAQAMSK